MREYRITLSTTVLLTCTVLAGCASTAKDDDPLKTNKVHKCSFDETYSCVERMGEKVRCFCADKDTLRELLEPTVE